jgi:hypothetical protein
MTESRRSEVTLEPRRLEAESRRVGVLLEAMAVTRRGSVIMGNRSKRASSTQSSSSSRIARVIPRDIKVVPPGSIAAEVG